MTTSQKIQDALWNIKTESDFNAIALQLFRYQVTHNAIYHAFVKSLSIDLDTVKDYKQIPCLPISFFKTQQIITTPQPSINNALSATVFTSSGTTGQITSKHYVSDLALYTQSFNKGFELFYGKPSDYCILTLLPNYLQRTGSSLVYMFDNLIKQSNHPLSGFYLHNLNELSQTIELLKKQNQKTILLGVTYALLDLADLEIKLNDNFIVMETGGMKGNRPEMLKEELHQLLAQKFNIKQVHSEYGMTELLSQAYSNGNGIYRCPPWMRVLVRDINDPFTYKPPQKTGVLTSLI